VHAELGRLAGPDVLAAAAAARLESGETVEALQLSEVALAADPDHVAARSVAHEAHEVLLAASTNFWESAWLSRELRRLG
jgi:hypothetical protein